MDTTFLNLFPGLTEERAIEILDTPLAELEDKYHRYVAAAHLVNFPSEASINALIRVLQNPDLATENRHAQRKAVESLGRLKVERAMDVIRPFLQSDDVYMVENTVWAISEIGTEDPEILEEIAQLLEKPNLAYRVIIQTLAKGNYQPAQVRIEKFIQSDDSAIACAAIAALAKLSGDLSQMDKIVTLLNDRNIHARRGAIQDLMDLKYYPAMPQIAIAPVSQSLRLRGLRYLVDEGFAAGELTFDAVENSLDHAIWDHANDLNMAYTYATEPSLAKVLEGLYSTDFGNCYLASQAMLAFYADQGPALEKSFTENAKEDYGAHYHIIKLFGWLNYAPAYDLFVDTLLNLGDKFVKSRIAAAISLGYLGDKRAIPHLHSSLNTKVWKLKYACLVALDCLGDSEGRSICKNDSDWLIQAKASATPKPMDLAPVS